MGWVIKEKVSLQSVINFGDLPRSTRCNSSTELLNSAGPILQYKHDINLVVVYVALFFSPQIN